MFVGTILLVVAASSMTLSVGAWVVPPAFCNGIDCPQYKTICNTSGFEIRSYPAAQWVSIDFEGPGTSDFQNAEHDGFKHLFDYITGANALGAKIDMTAPVNDKIVPGSGPNCNTTFTISFFIPFKYSRYSIATTKFGTKSMQMHSAKDWKASLVSRLFTSFLFSFRYLTQAERFVCGEGRQRKRDLSREWRWEWEVRF